MSTAANAGSHIHRVLVAIPAFNEEASITAVVVRVREALPELDLLVVDDGSSDQTGAVLERLGVRTATHLCNLGYGRAIQTAIKYALRRGYSALVTLDADGQHAPEQVRQMLAGFETEKWDYLVGSRYVSTRDYSAAPAGRRLGMQLFSLVTQLATGRRIYDTTSGLKIIRRSVFEPLTFWHFVDFHAEAIVYLSRLGYRVGEFPVTMQERSQGASMYSALSHLVYPLMTSLMVFLAAVHAQLSRRRRA